MIRPCALFPEGTAWLVSDNSTVFGGTFVMERKQKRAVTPKQSNRHENERACKFDANIDVGVKDTDDNVI